MSRFYDAAVGKYHYFQLSLSKGGQEIAIPPGNQEVAYAQSMAIDPNVYLVTSLGDTLALADYSYAPTYGAARSTIFLLAFQRAEKRNPEWIRLHIDELGLETGSLRFTFQGEDLERVAMLK